MKRTELVRGDVRYRCGATATVEYPADAEASFRRFKEDAARRDCEGCHSGRNAGSYLQVADGRIELWHFREVSNGRDAGDGAPSRGGGCGDP